MQIVTELPDGVARSQEVATRVEVLVDGAVEHVLDEVTDGSVSFSGSADARARYAMSVIGLDDLIPTGADSPLNVYGTELAIYRGLKDATDTYLVPLGIFGIDRSTTSEDGSSVDIALSGRDRAGKFISPEGSFETAGQVLSGTLAGEAIIDVLTGAWPDMPYDADAFASVVVPLPAVAWDEGEDRWAFASGIAEAIGAQLYFNRVGILTIAQIPVLLDTSAVAASIVEGDGGTLLNIERDWDRSRVINRWTVYGQNPSNDPDAPVPRAVALDNDPDSPTYYYGTFGKRSDSTNNSFVGSDVQAADMANGLLVRSIGAPDQINFGAITDPARNPFDIVFIERSRLGVASNQILDEITIPLDAESDMSASTRITQALT